MLQWCMEHYILTFVIVLAIIETINNCVKAFDNCNRLKYKSSVKDMEKHGK